MNRSTPPRRHDPNMNSRPPTTPPSAGSARQRALRWETTHGRLFRMYCRTPAVSWDQLPLRERENIYAEMHFTFYGLGCAMQRVHDSGIYDRVGRQSHAMLTTELLPWLLHRRRDKHGPHCTELPFGSAAWRANLVAVWGAT